jgi:hypothetical protein
MTNRAPNPSLQVDHTVRRAIVSAVAWIDGVLDGYVNHIGKTFHYPDNPLHAQNPQQHPQRYILLAPHVTTYNTYVTKRNQLVVR